MRHITNVSSNPPGTHIFIFDDFNPGRALQEHFTRLQWIVSREQEFNWSARSLLTQIKNLMQNYLSLYITHRGSRLAPEG